MMDIVALENHLNLDLEIISISDFSSVYQALASQNQVQNCNIDYEDYKGGYCFWDII